MPLPCAGYASWPFKMNQLCLNRPLQTGTAMHTNCCLCLPLGIRRAGNSFFPLHSVVMLLGWKIEKKINQKMSNFGLRYVSIWLFYFLLAVLPIRGHIYLELMGLQGPVEVKDATSSELGSLWTYIE